MKGPSFRTIATKPKPTTNCYKCNSDRLFDGIPMVTLICGKCDAEMSVKLPLFYTHKDITFQENCHKEGNLRPL